MTSTALTNIHAYTPNGQAPAVAVAQLLLNDPASAHYGYALLKAGPFAIGTLYSVLDRFQQEGWINRGVPLAVGGRPQRRYFTVTDTGKAAMEAMLAGSGQKP